MVFKVVMEVYKGSGQICEICIAFFRHISKSKSTFLSSLRLETNRYHYNDNFIN